MRFRPGVAAGCLMLVVACSRGGGDDTGDVAAPAGSLRVPVTTAAVVTDSLANEATFAGRLIPLPGGAAVLAAPAAGLVEQISVQMGARVRRGTPVATISAPELAATAREQRIAAEQAKREADRQRQLLADGVTSRRQAEEAEAAAATAEALARGSAELLARTRVVSPIAGRVQRIALHAGQRVDAGAVLAEVVRADTLDAEIQIPANRLRGLKAGDLAHIKEEGDTAWRTGRVAAIAPGVDSITNAASVLIRVPNPGLALHPGATAAVRLRFGVL